MTTMQTSTAVRGSGTLRWQSPELWNDEPKSFQSDVWAFGMTIVEVNNPQTNLFLEAEPDVSTGPDRRRPVC